VQHKESVAYIVDVTNVVPWFAIPCPLPVADDLGCVRKLYRAGLEMYVFDVNVRVQERRLKALNVPPQRRSNSFMNAASF
jgi:hypothetical protein